MKFVGYFLCCLLLVACVRKNPQIPANKQEEQPSDTQQLLEYNRACYQAELDEIQAFLDSSSHSYKATEEGIWYCLLTAGEGPNLAIGQAVSLACQVELLDGTICEASTPANPMKLVIGKRDWLQGIDFLLPYLQNKSEALVIIPSHAAYGIRGKAPCITARTPILCRIKILATHEKDTSLAH